MASALSNRILFVTPVPTATRTLSTARTVLAPPRRLSWSPGGNSFSRFPELPRRHFAETLKVAESDPETMDEEEVIQAGKNGSEDTMEGLLTMNTLVEAYKEAILNEDENAVSEVETTICSIGKQKNELLDKVEQLKSDITSEKEKFLRLNADFENFRKNAEKDHLKFKSDIQGELIGDLLLMVDSFEMAKQQIQAETEKEKKIDTSYHGIYKQFVEALRASRVAVIETVGKNFDPSIHEAVGRMESEQFREGIVIQEVRRGFVLGDRIIRPAMVKVSSGPGIKKPPSSGEKPVAAGAESDKGSVPASDAS